MNWPLLPVDPLAADPKMRFDKDVPPPPAPPQATIVLLGRSHREAIRSHLHAFDERDRYLRFGYPATNEQIDHYVDHLDFRRDDVYGVFDSRLRLVGMAHLAFGSDAKPLSMAEFGVSVSPSARGRGLGGQLFAHAAQRARMEGVQQMFIHALSENVAMLRIARRAGARIERSGGESQAYLTLPPDDLREHLKAIIDDQTARVDHGIRAGIRQLRGWAGAFHDVRRELRDKHSDIAEQ